MNCKLAIPALSILVAFVTLFAVMATPSSARNPKAARTPPGNPSDLALSEPLDRKSAERHLSKILIEPYRWRPTARRLMSRAGPPRSQAPILTIEPLSHSEQPYFVGSLLLRDQRSLYVPFTLDRRSGSTSVFANNQWQTHDEWLAQFARVPKTDE